QLFVAQPGRRGPVQTDPLRTLQALPNRRLADPAATGDPALAQTTLREKSQNLSYLPHADSPCWHRGPLLKGTQDARATQPPRVVDAVSGNRFRSKATTCSSRSRPPIPTDRKKWPPSGRNGWSLSVGISGRLRVGIAGRFRPENAVKTLMRVIGLWL